MKYADIAVVISREFDRFENSKRIDNAIQRIKVWIPRVVAGDEVDDGD